MDSSLLPFFRPRGVVVVGASTSPEKLGFGVARNLVRSSYGGAIHFVSQKPGTLLGRPLYAGLGEIPDPVDLAVLIVPPAAMPQALQQCAERGIHAAVLVSSGFREAGPQGAALEDECVRIARQAAIRLLGPNCIGIIDTHLPLDTTFLQSPLPARGRIALISHSGAFCAAVVDWANGQGLGFSRLVSLGNQADVNETELLPVLASDEHTRAIALYMEGVSDGRRFVETARGLTRKVPLIALKVGRSDAGQRAAASHTGMLAASDAAFDAAFEKAGILRANTTEQLLDWAGALATCSLPRGRRVAILTDAGGPGVIAADALGANGLTLASLSSSTLEALSATLPAAASVRNPVDMLASASPGQYAACLGILLEDPNVDSALVIVPAPPTFKAEEVAQAILPVMRGSDKPVVVALMGSKLVQAAARFLAKSDIPAFNFPERAASALAALARRAEYLAAPSAAGAAAEPAADPAHGANDIAGLLEAYGIRGVPTTIARSVEEAISGAIALGFPVVLKIASSDIPHKSDAGGVRLNLHGPDELRSAYFQLHERVAAAFPLARIDGVQVQRQVPDGQDVILGMLRDPQFGPLLMFGSGGVEVEALKDVAFALAPLELAEAQTLLRKTWAGRRLKGFRGLPPADEAAVIDALTRLSWLAMRHPEVEELEINPLRVLGNGALALDIRGKLVTAVGGADPMAHTVR